MWHYKEYSLCYCRSNEQNTVQGDILIQINDKYVPCLLLDATCLQRCFLLHQTCLIATFCFKDDQRLLPANGQTWWTVTMKVRARCLELWQKVGDSNTLQHIVDCSFFKLLNSQQKKWLNQVGTKKTFETIMNMQLFLREETAESNEISWNKSYGLSCNETTNTYFTNMKRHFQFNIVRCWLLYYCNQPICTMGFKQNRRDKTVDFLI